MANLDTLVEEISGLSLLQTAELVKMLESKLGVSAAAPVAAVAAAPAAGAPAAGGAAPAAPVVEAKTAFDVILKSIDPTKKIGVIKEVRVAVPGLGLAEAKTLVESAPKPIREGVTKDEAEDIKKKIEAAGGVVEIQ